MAKKHVIKPEHLGKGKEIHLGRNNGSYRIELDKATQEQLAILFDFKNDQTGDREFAYLFEEDKKADKEK